MISSVRGFFRSGSPSFENEKERLKELKDKKFLKQLETLKQRLAPLFRSDPSQVNGKYVNDSHFHDDRSLRRFLVAAGDLETAYENVLRYNHWRQTMAVDTLSPTDPDILELIALGFVHSLRIKDAMGRPVLYVIARKHFAGNRDLDKMQKFIVYMLEMTIKRMEEHVNDSICLVFDLLNFSLANMDYPFVKKLVWLLTKYYPERLGICIIYNAPVLFQGCWPVIRHWLNEKTGSKVVFVNSKEAMSEYLEVDGLPPPDM
ncbi:hypothetical protein EGW08_013893 [Elysia chlorotica]|uniref:CRAL-TRIO domain-containing protein n=1 Tax=Elysia chlorotica TaxID=188477 RepID=A0A3S0ZYJ5_ELYCH|nr:hypothetical protein EGW08_013893 [Elysia chlorotica]